MRQVAHIRECCAICKADPHCKSVDFKPTADNDEYRQRLNKNDEILRDYFTDSCVESSCARAAVGSRRRRIRPAPATSSRTIPTTARTPPRSGRLLVTFIASFDRTDGLITVRCLWWARTAQRHPAASTSSRTRRRTAPLRTTTGTHIWPIRS